MTNPARRIEQLKSVLEGAKSPLVVIYGNPDPDALAGAWTLSEMARTWKVGFRMVYTGEVVRAENEAMIRRLRIRVGPRASRLLEPAAVGRGLRPVAQLALDGAVGK